MKKSVKAALLSAQVFPGVGHSYLQRHVYAVEWGYCIAGVVLALATSTQAQFVNTVTVAFVVARLIGIVDSYRIKREQDRVLATELRPFGGAGSAPMYVKNLGR